MLSRRRPASLAALVLAFCACALPDRGVLRAGAMRGEAAAAAGHLSATTTSAGGELWTADGAIVQADIAGIVYTHVMRGQEVHILTGVHGAADGAITAEAWFFAQDLASFGRYPGVSVWNLGEMSPAAIARIVNGPGVAIGAFCNSAVGLAPWIH